MKDTFTIKEITDGTGLTRQRIHALIKSRDIPAHTDKNKFIINWDNLLKMADNASMLSFIKVILDKEKQKIDDGYKVLRENAKGMMYAYVFLLESQLPTPEGADLDWIRLFRKAYYYWFRLKGSIGCHWALEADKYDYLDEEYMD